MSDRLEQEAAINEERPKSIEELPQKVSKTFRTEYVNYVHLSGSSREFQFVFCSILKGVDGKESRESLVNVVMSPQVAADFSQALVAMLTEYNAEQQKVMDQLIANAKEESQDE